MCKYFKKKFTCGHLSEVYIDRCLAAFTPGAEACTPSNDSDHDPEAFKEQLLQEAHTSHFACFKCIKAEAIAELEAAASAAAALEQDPGKRAEIIDQQARYASKATKAQANRKAAEEKMKTERERDRAEAEAQQAEKNRAARGEGMWIQTGSVRRKGKHGRGFHNPDSPAQSAPPTPTFKMGVDGGVGGRAGKMGEFKKDEPRSANEADGGRAGAWPRKILSKGENSREGW